jgi:hypothetical protein
LPVVILLERSPFLPAFTFTTTTIHRRMFVCTRRGGSKRRCGPVNDGSISSGLFGGIQGFVCCAQ